MKRRSAVRFVMWSLAATVGCSSDAAGPSTPACSSALASQVVLAIGAYPSINPASDKVCGNLTCSTSAFKTVGARVQSVGAHIAIYVDTLAPANGLTTTDFDSLRTVFDNRLYPLDTVAFGREPDVDSNGVVIVLMTGVVNQLVTATQCATSGFVAGFFYSADLDPRVRAVQR